MKKRSFSPKKAKISDFAQFIVIRPGKVPLRFAGIKIGEAKSDSFYRLAVYRTVGGNFVAEKAPIITDETSVNADGYWSERADEIVRWALSHGPEAQEALQQAAGRDMDFADAFGEDVP